MRTATTLLTPGEMGKMSLVLATTGFFSLFLINPVGMFINRRLHTWYATGRARHYFNLFWAYLFAVSLFAAVCLVVLNSFGILGFEMQTSWLLFLVCGSLLFNTANQTVIPSLNLLGHSGWFILLTVANVAMGFVLATLLVKYEKATAEFWMLGLLVGQALLAVAGAKVLYIFIKKNGAAASVSAMKRSQITFLFTYTWPVAIAVGLGWIHTQGYRYLMQDSLGLAPLGLFVAGYGISAGLIVAFESIVTAYFQPRFFRDISVEDKSQQNQAWHRYTAAIVPALIFTMICIAALSTELTKLFLGPAFQSAAEFVIWGALAEAARVCASTFSLLAHAHMRTKWLIFPSLAGAILSVVLTVALSPLLGPSGAGIALTLAGGGFIAAMYLMLIKRVNMVIPIRAITLAFIFGIVVWGLSAFCRPWFANAPSLVSSISIMVISGIAYLVLQYILLRAHLKN